ncbi:translation initiation factor IF-2-like isoform X2 [Bubalus kerabau]|uniref:translation initiation factor IF-2-like isoform X2 n=1 Tax=Bubalus carabanensis TaxID=3119969 RepID=UPI00244E7B94|nr:translation initiation factor IF-2-like isoform X2 [Bubalus carabanensis]XP_055428035.1 translation initiation factor IF-2-like isoform X2 [Bubalus carabanensis]XP_055428036.1 translation initiation factor IF-2-like isoform X2 [Bubalus carabanensis]XP_055428037.1 translation initiation factor IF-2-like isoform X2 [Bubalus carabanensis]
MPRFWDLCSCQEIFFRDQGPEAENREDPLIGTGTPLPRGARTPGKAGFKGGDAAGDSAVSRMVPPYSPQGVCLASPRLVNRRQLRCAGEALTGPTPGVRGQAGRPASAEPGPSPAPARRVPRAPGTRPSPGRGRARRRSARGPRREPQPRARPSWTVPGPHPAELSPPPPGLPQTAGERLREAPAQPGRDRRRRPRASNSFWAGRATAPTHQRPAREEKQNL